MAPKRHGSIRAAQRFNRIRIIVAVVVVLVALAAVGVRMLRG